MVKVPTERVFHHRSVTNLRYPLGEIIIFVVAQNHGCGAELHCTWESALQFGFHGQTRGATHPKADAMHH